MPYAAAYLAEIRAWFHDFRQDGSTVKGRRMMDRRRR